MGREEPTDGVHRRGRIVYSCAVGLNASGGKGGRATVFLGQGYDFSSKGGRAAVGCGFSAEGSSSSEREDRIALARHLA